MRKPCRLLIASLLLGLLVGCEATPELVPSEAPAQAPTEAPVEVVPTQAPATVLQCGRAVEGTISAERDTELWTLEVEPGTRVRVAMEAAGDELDPYLRFHSAGGQLLEEDDDGGEGRDSLISDLWLPIGGTYEVAATRFAGEGSYTLRLDCSTEPPGEPVASIERPLTFTGSIDDERPFHARVFAGSSGDRVRVTMADAGAGTLDSYLRLYGPDGSLLARDDDGGDGLDAQLELVLPSGGEYRLILTRYGDSRGDFVATLELVFTLPPEIAEAAQALYAGAAVVETSQVFVVGPVEPGTTVQENTPVDGDGPGVELEVPDAGGPHCVFFIDDQPQSAFAHPVRYAWFDLGTGAYEVVDAAWEPLLVRPDGASYGVEASGSGYIRGVRTVFGQVDTSYAGGSERRGSLALALQGARAGLTPSSVRNPPLRASSLATVTARREALVVDGGAVRSFWTESALYLACNAERMEAWLRAGHNGRYTRIHRYSQMIASPFCRCVVAGGTRSLESADPASNNPSTGLEAIIQGIAAGMATCPSEGHHHFFLYIMGHGERGQLNPHRSDCSADSFSFRYVDLARSLAAFNSRCVDITVLIDSCYSGSAVLQYQSEGNRFSPPLASLCRGRSASNVTIITTGDADHSVPLGCRYLAPDSGTEDFLEADGNISSGDLRARWRYMRSETGHANPQFCTCQNDGTLKCQ